LSWGARLKSREKQALYFRQMFLFKETLHICHSFFMCILLNVFGDIAAGTAENLVSE
jgi:hypothetical protein